MMHINQRSKRLILSSILFLYFRLNIDNVTVDAITGTDVSVRPFVVAADVRNSDRALQLRSGELQFS